MYDIRKEYMVSLNVWDKQGFFFAILFRVTSKQSYEIKLPSQAFLDGRASPWRKLRQVGCYDVAKFRLVTIESYALIHSCCLSTSLNFATF